MTCTIQLQFALLRKWVYISRYVTSHLGLIYNHGLNYIVRKMDYKACFFYSPGFHLEPIFDKKSSFDPFRFVKFYLHFLGNFVGWNVLLCFSTTFFTKSVWFHFELFELGAWILSNLSKSCLPSSAFLHKIIRHFDINFWLLSPKIPLCTYELSMYECYTTGRNHIFQNMYVFQTFQKLFCKLMDFSKTEITEIFLWNCKCTTLSKYFVKI